MMGNRTVYLVTLYTTIIVVANGMDLAGTLQRCRNEGMPVKVDDIDKNQCFKCICRGGHVECKSPCASIDGCHLIMQEGCCQKCRGCIYEGAYHASHTEWTNPKNPCTIFWCEAGVITESSLHCSVNCPNPLPPEPGQCCPSCPECKVNGQIASDDRDIVISDDPCLTCRCNDGRLVCSKKACPVLQCGKFYQVQYSGECCPKCKGTRAMITPEGSCMLQQVYIKNNDRFSIDMCTNCTCKDETSICKRVACPILNCSPEFQESGKCCKKCKLPENTSTSCYYEGNIYEAYRVLVVVGVDEGCDKPPGFAWFGRIGPFIGEFYHKEPDEIHVWLFPKN